MSLWKVHHGIMKSTAIEDYEAVKEVCVEFGYPIHEPKGKHWHRIEDATGLMVRQLTIQQMDKLDLNRGVDYYCDLQNLHHTNEQG